MNTCNLFSYVITIFYFANGLCHGIFIHKSGLKIRNRRENSDECRPFPPPSNRHHGYRGPQHRHKYTLLKCCELPEILSVEEGSFEKCHDLLCKPGYSQTSESYKSGDMKNIKRASEESQIIRSCKYEYIEKNLENTKKSSIHLKRHDKIKFGLCEQIWRKLRPDDVSQYFSRRDNSEEGNETPLPVPLPAPPMDFFQDKNQCLLHCVFTESGLLTGDGLLNEDLLHQNKPMQMIANNTKWAATIDPVYRKCITAAKEVNSQSQKLCKLGPSEYMKCMSRELFFNCPSDFWVDSAECDKFKNKLEKCPNLWAPYPPFYETYPPFRKPCPPSREPYPTFHEYYGYRRPISIRLTIDD